ncbi:MAG: hypothetical protein QOG68_973, partial [Solirubrobacteraceae bacterium]|nr:hypothetical protein [Solirubrobacteraceae bacterium]
CDIRHDLAASYDRGVRASGRARRHLRDCDGCSTYRAQLRSVRQGFASLSPSPAVTGLFAKLLGLGGASSAGAAGAAGTGSVAIGGAAAVSIGKVAAIVCCAAALTGGAVEVQKVVAPVTGTHTSPAKRINDRTLEAAVSAPAAISAAAAVAAIPHHHARHQVDVVNPLAVLHPPVAVDKPNKNGVGGALAPADTTATEPTVGTPTPTPADTLPAIDDPSIVALPGDGETSTTAATSGSSSSSSSSTSGSGSASGSSGSGSTSGSTSAGSSDATTAGTASTTSGSTGGSTSSSGGASPSGPPATTQTHP